VSREGSGEDEQRGADRCAWVHDVGPLTT
jgi:hypothetical protein